MENHKIQTEFFHAARDGKIDIIKVLLKDKRVDPAARNNHAIAWAAENGHYDVVKFLMADKRVNPSDDNNYAIRKATQNGHYDIFKLLMEDERVNPAGENNYILRWAINNEHYPIVDILLTKDVRVWDCGFDHIIIDYITKMTNKCILSTPIIIDISTALSSKEWFNGHDDLCNKISIMAFGMGMIKLGNRTGSDDNETMLSLLKK